MSLCIYRTLLPDQHGPAQNEEVAPHDEIDDAGLDDPIRLRGHTLDSEPFHVLLKVDVLHPPEEKNRDCMYDGER
jgi:hypothetical protein